MDLMGQMLRLNQELTNNIAQLRQQGDAVARTERDYQSAKSQTWLRMRTEGVSVTEVKDSIKGHVDVVNKLFARDKARVDYDVTKECINVYKLQLKLIENQIAREWGESGRSRMD